MFTTKPKSGEKITKLGGSLDAKTPFTERPATYASKSSGGGKADIARNRSTDASTAADHGTH